MYDIYNQNRVKVATIHAKEARYALADFLTYGVGGGGYGTNAESIKQRRLEIIRDANQPSTRGAAEYNGVTAVRKGRA